MKKIFEYWLESILDILVFLSLAILGCIGFLLIISPIILTLAYNNGWFTLGLLITLPIGKKIFFD